jgi:RHS repeat-associated protein
LTTAAGAYSGELQFLPWGQVWTNTGSGFQVYAKLLQYDPETDGYHTPNRYYIPRHDRWLTPDPGGLSVVKPDDPQTWNMYAYVRGNPVTLTDANGLQGEGAPAGAEGSGCTNANADTCNMSKGDITPLPLPQPSPLPPPPPPLPLPPEGGPIEPLPLPGVSAGVLGLAAVDLALLGYDIYKGYELYESHSLSQNKPGREITPDVNKDAFDPIRVTPARRNKITGEVWVPDKSGHYGGRHWEVYRNTRDYEKGNRDRAVDPIGNTIKQY